MSRPTLSQDHFLLWAKLPHKKDGTKNFFSYHPLICHMLDVAVVADTLWQEVLSDAARNSIAAGFGLDLESARVWLKFLAALHDLGKASPAFQLREEAKHLSELFQQNFNQTYCTVKAHELPHGWVTAKEGKDLLKNLSISPKTASDLSVLIGGHHGIFPTSHDLVKNYRKDGAGRQSWQKVRQELFDLLTELFQVKSFAKPQKVDSSTIVTIAGLVSVADWIGSNEDFFPYLIKDYREQISHTPQQYLEDCEIKAINAVKTLGWTGWKQPEIEKQFIELFPFASDPRPLQQTTVALGTRLNPEASIVIIEAPMGEGKTEAALYLADKWGVKPGPRGFYVALPTTATSNQMFSRVKDFLSFRYPSEQVNFQLLHGYAAISAEFKTLKKAFHLSGVYSDRECPPDTMNVVAAEWFTHRKRSLLAPFGVGTVDQALMTILQTKHYFVRLFGLSHKTVIIDEVHAYDAYMSKLLELLLKWLAALGSPVVLLSATLPQKRREMLLKAYCQGLGYNCVTPQTISSYPRISWATRNGQEIVCNEEKLTTSESIKETTVKWVDGAIDPESSKFNLGEQLKSALSEGGCAVVICNTVIRAQEVYKKLKDYFSENELLLFHARFLFTDRDMKEEEVRSKFGKPSEKIESDSENKQERRKVERPYRSVLVATQVVEQSLDIDFDLMVTDIAPVDLVLQRLGRLHRHKRESRPNKLTKPQLWITEPKKIVDDTPTFDEGTEVVYDKHILLRSWLALKEKIEKDSLLSTPEDIEPLVEAVYSNQSCPQNATEQLKNYWEETYEELKEELQNMETKAKEVQIRPPNHEDGILNGTNEDLKEDNPEVHKSLQALTRLSDGPTVSVTILTEIESKKYNFNNPPDFEEVEYFLRHSVNLSRRDFVNHLFEITDREKLIPAGWKLSPFLRHHRLIKVDESGKWRSEKYELNLDPELGIIISKLD